MVFIWWNGLVVCLVCGIISDSIIVRLMVNIIILIISFSKVKLVCGIENLVCINCFFILKVYCKGVYLNFVGGGVGYILWVVKVVKLDLRKVIVVFICCLKCKIGVGCVDNLIIIEGGR